MNLSLRNRVSFFVTVASLFALVTPAAFGQAFYVVQKNQGFIQTSSAGPVSAPNNAFGFSAQADTATTLTFPSGSTQPMPFVSGDNSFEINTTYTTKAALDAAYPNGTYRFTGTGLPSAGLSFNLTTELYPTVTPQVINGTWNAGGLLVVNPTQTTTITLNAFTGYATSGVAGHMQTRIQGLSDNVRLPPNDNGGILSVANPFGIPVTTTPITTITIPAGVLTSGRVYSGEVDFETATTFDSTTVAGAATVAIFGKSLTFYIAAATTGDGGPAAVITTQPTNQTGTAGGTVTIPLGLNLGSNGGNNNNTSVIWSFNGQVIQNIDGNKYTFANGFSLQIKNLTAADAGNYSATITNTGGIVTSNTATLTVGAAPTPTAPVITTQPVAKNVATSSTVVFSVTATGSPAPTYQWRKDGVNLTSGVNGVSGATSATLVINSASVAASAGSYSVVVSNGVGTPVTSTAVTLTVTQTNDPGRLTNLSVLTDISADASFTVGTVVGGSGTSGNKALVVRAAGPSLGALGVPGTIGDPQLTLFNASSVAIATNDNWGGDATTLATLTNAMASVGAFAFTGPTSKDAAVYQPSLTPGNYSVAVSGTSGATGTAIAEIYDATPAGTFTPLSSRLINVSVLKSIPSGGFLTLGFTIGGSVAKTVLIRVVGPGLATVGLTSGTLGDPQLTLFNSASAAIASNDDWGADPQLINAASRVNAFSIGNAPTKDAVLMITLPAGGYTAQARGGANTSGIATIHVTHDLTEERAIRSQLVTTDRLASIGRLAAGVAHEINNPAAFVTVNLGVLRDRFLAGTARTQDVLSMLDDSLNGMERIREIVRDLKGFAREKSVDLVDLGAVAQSAIRMAAHETRGRARVERVAEEGAVARVRGARIAQVVLNLVVNAAQAITAGNASENRIVVRTLRAGDKARIEVSDTGTGVDPDLADRIFEPFFTTRERTGGTGLGLWLARGIVEEEGGTLTFHDEPGGGACFVVELPAASAEGGEARTRDSLRIRAV